MTYTLRMRGIIIGKSDLEQADASAHIARGRFRRGLGYELVQPIFLLRAGGVPNEPDGTGDAEMLARYLKARDALPLELADTEGRVIVGAVIDIIDRTVQDGPASLTLEVHIARDPAFWERHRVAF
jgi:hypothetical protein